MPGVQKTLVRYEDKERRGRGHGNIDIRRVCPFDIPAVTAKKNHGCEGQSKQRLTRLAWVFDWPVETVTDGSQTVG
ncbi:hypothetical protein JAAARDRAFT_33905 [Jaapia argillacea MUCL 33604]|uniref:Uncharacterized protein n=1 Tax=Jaapia argillacea MUCL 33604 TaxID=933084 RepID=A0A067PWT5_9AGAM|nr:hypothetical protein JAAARDRAFT_33905 [Jaapia argillacea MUCL 33604]